MVRRYIREGSLFSENAAAGWGYSPRLKSDCGSYFSRGCVDKTWTLSQLPEPNLAPIMGKDKARFLEKYRNAAESLLDALTVFHARKDTRDEAEHNRLKQFTEECQAKLDQARLDFELMPN
jgi:hypothetical protein